MTIGKRLTETLRSTTAQPQPQSIAAVADGVHATAHVADLDRYSVALRQLQLTLDDACAQPGERIREQAAAIVRRLNFLEEPLAVWELDVRGAAAQLRSTPPERDGEAVHYWEVALEHDGARASATLGRYQWAPGQAERETQVAPATFGALARVADALAVALRDG